eukprot:165416-Prymnesium_polylepis.1
MPAPALLPFPLAPLANETTALYQNRTPYSFGLPSHRLFATTDASPPGLVSSPPPAPTFYEWNRSPKADEAIYLAGGLVAVISLSMGSIAILTGATQAMAPAEATGRANPMAATLISGMLFGVVIFDLLPGAYTVLEQEWGWKAQALLLVGLVFAIRFVENVILGSGSDAVVSSAGPPPDIDERRASLTDAER